MAVLRFFWAPWVYHVFVHLLAQRLLSHIRQHQLLRAGDRVGVAVSAGIDSIALLRLLLELRGELGIVLSVVHFNHKLRRAESDADERFVAELAREHDLEFYVDTDDVTGHARDEGVSLETAARELRYGFFRHLLGNQGKAGFPTLSAQKAQGQGSGNPDSRLNKIVTGHTLDDQAETVLMRLIRGAGPRGLGGIYPRIAVEDEDGELCAEIVRPLLGRRRRELEQYLREVGQTWREDASNVDVKFTRNRVRRRLVPLLEKEFNPAMAEHLAELAEIARDEQDYWENEIAGWMGTAVHWSEPDWARSGLNLRGLVQIAPSLSVEGWSQGRKPSALSALTGRAEAMPLPDSRAASASQRPDVDSILRSKIENAPWRVMNASVDRLWFLSEPSAVQRRLVKAIGEHAGIPLEFKHVQEILELAAENGASGKELALPLGWKVAWQPEQFLFLTPDLRGRETQQDYQYELKIPGRVLVPETGSNIEVRLIPAVEASEYNSEQLLDADSVRGVLTLRNWRPGDRFWPAHTKSPKKIKELLQERHVPQPERKLWPVVVSGREIVWMRGFLPARLRAKARHEALLIQELPLRQETVKVESSKKAPGGTKE